MEYAEDIFTTDPNILTDNPCNYSYMQHVGYTSHVCGDKCGPSCAQKLFAPKNIKKMSRKITQLLQGVNEEGRPIIVTNNQICNVLSQVYTNFRPETGDIYSRYVIPQSRPFNYTQNMIDQTINIITSQIKDEIGMAQNNAKLTAWTQVLGNFNNHGLRSHAPIKILEKRPQPMAFNMNY
jgi:hypothetical protein